MGVRSVDLAPLLEPPVFLVEHRDYTRLRLDVETQQARIEEQWAEHDPIERYRSWLHAHADMTDDEEDDITTSVKRLLNEALERAEESPLPDPAGLAEDVFASPEELDTPHHM